MWREALCTISLLSQPPFVFLHVPTSLALTLWKALRQQTSACPLGLSGPLHRGAVGARSQGAASAFLGLWRVRRPHSLSEMNRIKINLKLYFNKKFSSLYEMLIWSELPIPSSFREVLLPMRQVLVLDVPESAWPSVLWVSPELSKALALVWGTQRHCRVYRTHALGGST